MKKFMFAVALVTSVLTGSASFARSIDLTPVVATVKGIEEGISEVVLLADGRLQVKPHGGSVQTTQLSEVVTKRLLYSASMLHDVEVESTHSMIVCRMMPPREPGLTDVSLSGYDAASQKFDSNPRLVLSNLGCYLTDKTRPKEDYMLRAVEDFRTKLVILALNTLK